VSRPAPHSRAGRHRCDGRPRPGRAGTDEPALFCDAASLALIWVAVWRSG